MPDQILTTLRRDSKQLFRRSDLLIDGFWGRYWLDLLLLVAVIMAGAALLRDARTRPPQRELIANKNGLVPFHIIAREDLRLAGMGDTPPPEERTGAVVGRYSFTYLAGGAKIDTKQLSSRALSPADMKNRVLMRLKVQATTLFAGMKPPYTASLMGSPAEHGTAALLEQDLLVLDLQNDGNSMAAVLAVPRSDQPTLAAFIARTDLLLVVDGR
jgi:hypothetical protein